MTEPNYRDDLPALTEEEMDLRHRIEYNFDSVTPQEYDRFILSRGRDRLAINCRDELRNLLDPKKHYTGLEVGFGTGIIYRRLAEIGNLELFGVERRPDFIAFAISQGRIRADHAREGDFHHIPFADDTFDVFTGVGVLNQRTDPMLFYREAGRVLRSGGYFFLPWVKPRTDSVQREMGYMQEIGLRIVRQESDLLIGQRP